VPYTIYIELFDSNGRKIASLNNKLYPGNNLKVCFQDYIKYSNSNIETYFARILRKPSKKGFRGSIRPHFYYQSKKSMASVHTQDGDSKSIFFDFYRSKNKDNYFLFLINPYKNKTSYNLRLLSNKLLTSKKIYESSLKGMGSKLLRINDFNNIHKDGLLQCNSTKGLKHYLVIADKNFEKFSVDHL